MSPGLSEFLNHGIIPFRIPAFGPLAFIALTVPLFVLRWRGKGVGYLLCFSAFFMYAWAALVYTIFDYLPTNLGQLEDIQHSRWSACLNMTPAFLSGEFDPRNIQVYGNFLLGVPFGFGLPFVARTTHKRAIALGLALAVGLELAQLLIGLLIYHGPYRSIDIDDVWLVFVGTLFGYGSLWTSAQVYRHLGWDRGAHIPVWNHLHGVLLSVTSPSGSSQPMPRPASPRPEP